MLDSNAYHASLYTPAGPKMSGYPPVSIRENSAADAADFARILAAAPTSRAIAPSAAASVAPADSADGQETDGYSFFSFIKDVIDVINPLQHIPVISAIYRHLTGDDISPLAHLAGDTLYGGPIGGAIALADIAYEKTTGNDIGATMLALVTDEKTAPPTALAQNIPAATSSPLSLAPTPYSWTNGEEPASHSTPAMPVLQTRGDDSALPPRIALQADSTTTPQKQEAPAPVARTAAAPEPIAFMPALPQEHIAALSLDAPAASKELIAGKMMEALDKYAQMKRPSLTARETGVY